MKKTIIICGSFFTILMSCFLLHAQNPVKHISEYFNHLHTFDQFNGNALIAVNNKIIYQQSLGFADQNKKILHTKNTQFPIASITKPFTATAILQLKQKGKLSLDDAVQKYLYEFPYQNVTIRHLLSNTSGLPQYYDIFNNIMEQDPTRLISNHDLIPVFVQNNLPLQFNPGDQWEYNNTNFCIAALIIEKVSGLTFAEYLHTYIFNPAGMKNTLQPANRKDVSPQQAERYTFTNLYTTTLENTRNIPDVFTINERSNFYGNGGMISTAEDLYQFDKSLYNGSLLGAEELEEAFTPAKLNNGKNATYYLDEKEVYYGLGWEIFSDEKYGKVVFHDGSLSGLTTMLMRNITKKQTIIILDNTGTNAVFAASNALLSMLNQQPYQPASRDFSRLYGYTVVEKEKNDAEILLNDYFLKPEKYRVTERQLIRLGYELLRHNKKENAIVVFKAATMIFPKNWNTFDSYGEALLLTNQKEEAIRMYKKSIELNPDNENGKKVLRDISGN
jgi:CubicO group peptidase (beta-lactamase class C family)